MAGRAASLAAEIKQYIGDAEVVVEATLERSEFSVEIAGKKVFSRLQERRLPDVDEVVRAYQHMM